MGRKRWVGGDPEAAAVSGPGGADPTDRVLMLVCESTTCFAVKGARWEGDRGGELSGGGR